MIRALLAFGTPTFDRDMGELSPWLELVMHRSAVRPRVSYLCVGRDPRDVGISWGNHLANMDLHAVRQARDAVDLATADNLLPSVPPAEATSRRERFRHWMLDATPVADSGSSLRFMLHHLATIWDTRDSSNVISVHYDDLKADLPGEMRRLARRLDITVPESTWPSLEQAATFDDMREHQPTRHGLRPGQAGQEAVLQRRRERAVDRGAGRRRSAGVLGESRRTGRVRPAGMGPPRGGHGLTTPTATGDARAGRARRSQ